MAKLVSDFCTIIHRILTGSLAAAYAAGALSAADCFKIAYHRGRLSHDIKTIAPEKNGAMMAVGLSENDVKPYLDKLPSSDTAVVACVNSPSNVTVSGDSAALDRLGDLLKPSGVFARRLKVENAYHSPHMQVIAEAYLDSIKDVKTLSPPKSAPSMVEVGPHGALAGPLKQILTANGKVEDTPYLSLLSRGQNAVTSSLETVGKLWTMGQQLDFLRVNAFEADPKPLTCLTDLPKYSWK